MGVESPLAQRKTKGATPHDLGAPNEQPWVQTNYTSYQDCNLWKDLGSDFVLQVYRAFVFTGGTRPGIPTNLLACGGGNPAIPQAL